MEPGVGDTSRRGDVSGVRVGCNEEEEEEKDMFARRWNQGSAIPPAEATSLVSECVAIRTGFLLAAKSSQSQPNPAISGVQPKSQPNPAKLHTSQPKTKSHYFDIYFSNITGLIFNQFQ